MTNKIKNFRDLDVWRKGIEIVNDIYDLTGSFPKKEMYGLASQLQRVAVSVPSNIAEGFNRFHNKEYKQFLYIALGSCAEVETHIKISEIIGYLNGEDKKILINKIEHESKMLRNFIKKLN
ncbi:MAG: four helix bundle protein [Candidatus Tantalella remota]|nr:four helix bundle protein [Candidatus Tantalella remota]